MSMGQITNYEVALTRERLEYPLLLTGEDMDLLLLVDTLRGNRELNMNNTNR